MLLVDPTYRGVVANVVFPTRIDRREDLGLPHRFDHLLWDGRRPNRRDVH